MITVAEAAQGRYMEPDRMLFLSVDYRAMNATGSALVEAQPSGNRTRQYERSRFGITVTISVIQD
jgi:hypothetical protein